MVSLREVRLELSYVVLALGVFFTLLVVLHYFLLPFLPPALLQIVNAFGNWVVWLVLVGPIFTLVGGWYFMDTIRKRREFERLIDVPSKAHFVRNQSRLEELVWYLPADYNRRFLDRKKTYRIRG